SRERSTSSFPTEGRCRSSRTTRWCRRPDRGRRGGLDRRCGSSGRSITSDDPYGSLDPGGDRPLGRPLYPEVGALRALIRGTRLRCPRCDEPGMFASWFRMKERCGRCHLRFEREEGGFLGAMTLNYTFAIVVWIAALVIALALTVPDVPVAPLIAVSVVIMVVMPLLTYPVSKGAWAAVEFLAARTAP